MFSDFELAYLAVPRLGRLATVSADGQPDADAVAVEWDGARFYVGGNRFQASRKYKNVAAGNAKVSLVIDDAASLDPWRPRGIKIQGVAEIVDHVGRFGPAKYFAITPVVSWSWGLDDQPVYRDGKLNWKPHRVDWRLAADG